MDTISRRFQIDWSKEPLDTVNRTILKKFNAEIHSQSAIECILALRNLERIKAENVDSIDVRIFDVAYNIIGGGEEGERPAVRAVGRAGRRARNRG